MNNSKALFDDFVSRLQLDESRDEILGIAHLVFEDFLSVSKTDLLRGKTIEISSEKSQQLDELLNRINTGEPVQYVLGHAFFYGRKFKVDSSVLIPRPETEELVSYVLAHSPLLSVLDIGTGSGCIPITIACEKPMVSVYATDVSHQALAVAGRNAASLNARVEFWEHDILNEEIPVNNLDVVVSNPPYIAQAERHSMKGNVLDYEPHLALFVPDQDPLIFYRVISAKASFVLRPGGVLMFEINERFGNDVASLLANDGYQRVEVIKDISGKDRIVKGIAGHAS